MSLVFEDKILDYEFKNKNLNFLNKTNFSTVKIQ